MKWWRGGILAVVISLSDVPVQITDQPFNVTVTVTGAQSATNYLRADLFKEGTTNYFGETYNGSSWYGGSDGKQYLPISIGGGTASAQLTARLSNPTSGEYPGPGGYKLRVRRYTSSGNSAGNDTQTPVEVQIALAVPTPTPTPTPTPKSTPTPTPKSSPTPKSAPTATPVLLANSSPALVATPPVLTQVIPKESQDAGSAGQIVQAEVSPAALASPSPLVAGSATAKSNWWAMGVMMLGGGVFGLAVYLLIRRAGTMEK